MSLIVIIMVAMMVGVPVVTMGAIRAAAAV
jgi:hypothetical protein